MTIRVIPVIDIRRGIAVHAVKGHRQNYRPLKAGISATADPIEVASKLKDRFGFDEMYAADLDGITEGEANLNVIVRLCGIGGLKIMVDAGIDGPVKAETLLKTGVAKVIVGTETLESLEALAQIVSTAGGRQITGSIDVRGGMVESRCLEFRGLRPPEAARIFEDRGVGELILLDLSRVGSEKGVDMEMVEETIGMISLPLLVGGGVSSIDDVLALKDRGASGVLVATALYRGRLGRRELDAVRR